MEYTGPSGARSGPSGSASENIRNWIFKAETEYTKWQTIPPEGSNALRGDFGGVIKNLFLLMEMFTDGNEGNQYNKDDF